MKELKLISALGNKDLILELVDFFNGGAGYAYDGEAAALRRRFAGCPLTELHLVCTQEATKILPELRAILADDYPCLKVCPIELPCQDIACDRDDETMRQLVYEIVNSLAADNLIIASGGRKTLTNRLVEAGLLYGCMGYLTITAPRGEETKTNIRSRTMEFNVLWIPARRFFQSRRDGLTRDDEIGDNFRSLYLLPQTMIDRLREERIGSDPALARQELAWLRRLPKADLHCHLGGAFDAKLLKEMAAALLADLQVSGRRCDEIRQSLQQRLPCPFAELTPDILLSTSAGSAACHCLDGIKPLFQGLNDPRHLLTAIFITALSQQQIETLCWHEPSGLALKDRLQWYMACGDLGGSSLLQTEGNLRRALRWLLEHSWQEEVKLLEVRFSPDNYTRAGLTIRQVIDTLLDEGACFMADHPGFRVNFLIMATRHKDRAAMIAHVAAAVTFHQSPSPTGPSLTGFDLAGQEEGNDPATFQDIFMPLHHHFINITIHAGEMADEDKIWQALYLLHAKRIGHGLKLVNNQKMMDFVRDYGIAIEMCPSSNCQTNHFRCFVDATPSGDLYPLSQYLHHGISVTVNTDNRGHSATTLSAEYLKAAHLTQGGLSKWDILRLVKNGFKAVFLPKDEKNRLLKEIDRQVFELVLDDFFQEGDHHAP